MGAIEITPEIKELNNSWRLLAGLVNELDAVLRRSEDTPEQRLAKIRELVAFARSHIGKNVPPSVMVEDSARPEYQVTVAALEAIITEREQRQSVGKPTFHYSLNVQGQMEGPFIDGPEHRVLADEEVDRTLREGWGDLSEGS